MMTKHEQGLLSDLEKALPETKPAASGVQPGKKFKAPSTGEKRQIASAKAHQKLGGVATSRTWAQLGMSKSEQECLDRLEKALPPTKTSPQAPKKAFGNIPYQGGPKGGKTSFVLPKVKVKKAEQQYFAHPDYENVNTNEQLVKSNLIG